MSNTDLMALAKNIAMQTEEPANIEMMAAAYKAIYDRDMEGMEELDGDEVRQLVRIYARAYSDGMKFAALQMKGTEA